MIDGIRIALGLQAEGAVLLIMDASLSFDPIQVISCVELDPRLIRVHLHDPSTLPMLQSGMIVVDCFPYQWQGTPNTASVGKKRIEDLCGKVVFGVADFSWDWLLHVIVSDTMYNSLNL